MSMERRRSKRPLFMALVMFVAVGLFVFLMEKNQVQRETVEAASLANFDPGYIISDYQMSNYNAMTEAEIQAFLTKKNPCNNKDKGLYDSLVAKYPNHKWQFENGHFVCLSEEKFGDGEALGKGETAARIIWQAAQDYKINPQVLIVLLEKEQGLITDTYPHNIQYRAATGYGCPDTAPCSSQYYGFKNQVRKAASLFRTVLDGGWTNYPLGNNYVQYNPNASCGGSVVNIKNRATSALYRYTPYQPNKAALAAGYGTASCGAYGNRNFYLYFEDWFGGVKQVTKWQNMETPRYLVAKKGVKYYDIVGLKYSNIAINEDKKIFFDNRTFTTNDKMCLRARSDVNSDKCILFSDLSEFEPVWVDMETPRFMEKNQAAEYMNLRTNKTTSVKKQYDFYDKKITLPNGEMCLKPSGNNGVECVKYSSLKEAKVNVTTMLASRYLVPKAEGVSIWDPIKNKRIGQVEMNKKVYYTKKLIDFTGQVCLLIDFVGVENACVRFADLSETWVDMERPREMKMLQQSYKIDAINLKVNNGVVLPLGMKRKFVMKRFMPNNEWCLQTEFDYKNGTNDCIAFDELSEL